MTIKEVSEITKLSEDTLRYYEKEGLIGPIKRNKNGIRDYEEKDINALEFIVCMRGAGLSIGALSKYLGLFKQGDKTIKERKEILENQRKILEEKLEKMNTAYKRLNYKIELYDNKLLENKLK